MTVGKKRRDGKNLVEQSLVLGRDFGLQLEVAVAAHLSDIHEKELILVFVICAFLPPAVLLWRDARNN